MNYLQAVVTNKCPKCRQGYLFKNKNPYNLKHTLDMFDACPNCKQKTEPEVGFYYGTGYVSYALSIAFIVSVFVAYAVLIGLSFKDNSTIHCMIVSIVGLVLLQPILMRLSRMFWLSWFVKYERGTEK